MYTRWMHTYEVLVLANHTLNAWKAMLLRAQSMNFHHVDLHPYSIRQKPTTRRACLVGFYF